MKLWKITLTAKEIGSKNKIKFTSKLTKEGMDNLVKSNVCEILDFPRKDILQAFKEGWL